MWERQRTGIGRLSNKPSSQRYFRAKGRADMNIELPLAPTGGDLKVLGGWCFRFRLRHSLRYRTRFMCPLK